MPVRAQWELVSLCRDKTPTSIEVGVLYWLYLRESSDNDCIYRAFFEVEVVEKISFNV